jgi:hypothetical protein
MAYCPPEMLDDLVDVLAEVHGWAGVVEKKPGVFYVGGQPFLHFHLLRGDRRRADIKGRSDWDQIELPRPIPVAAQKALLRRLRARYAEKPNRAAAGASRHERTR